MKDISLISITKVTDDDTGMYSVGDLDYSINVGALADYLAVNPVERKKALWVQMAFLMGKIDEYARDAWEANKKQGQSETLNQGLE